MAVYGPAEIPRVLLVRPDVRATGLLIMADFEAQFPGEKLFIPPDGGWRSMDDQTRDWLASEKGKLYRVAPPNNKAAHTQGAALDFQIVGTDQDPARDQRDPRYIALGAIIESHGMRAGINFRSGQPDPYHADTNETADVMVAKFDALKKKVLAFSASPFSRTSSSATK